MRSTALLMCLVATVASAQQQPAPTAPPEFTPPPTTAAPGEPTPPPPPPSVTPPPSPSAVGPAEPAGERAVRYSRFSAGPGGPLVVFTQVISGIVSGAQIGSAYDDNDNDENNNAYTGAMLTGLTLGTASTLYQYFVPVERNESLLVAGAAIVGFTAGMGIARSQDLADKERGLLGLVTTQAGVISVLALTAGGGDVSNGDAALVGMTSLYALTLTGLLQYIYDEQTSGDTDYLPTVLAPAIGMALGGLLTVPLEMESSRVLKLTLLPLGVGASMLWLGATIADGTTVPVTALAGIVTTFALTVLLTTDPGVPTEKDGLRRADFQAMPVPVVMAAGRDNSSLAAGPGLFVSF